MAGIRVVDDVLMIDTDSEIVVYDETIRFVNFDITNGEINGTVAPIHEISGQISLVKSVGN